MVSNAKANAALAASLIFLFLSSAAAYLAFSRLNTSDEWVHHTQDVQGTLAEYSMTLARAGRARTAFTDSGNPALIPRIAAQVAEIRRLMESVDQLTADNPRQQANIDKLKELTERRIALMDRSIELKRSGQSTLQEQVALTRQTLGMAEETDAVLQQMYSAEAQLMQERRERVRSSAKTTIAVLLTSLLLSLILFLVHHHLLTEQVRARAQAEATQRALSARLLTLQDEERRRFARELHDSVGQHLAALKMALSLLQKKYPVEPITADSLAMVDEAIGETRTISHLLHPPLLDEAGFASAAQWFVEGFSKRSGIETSLEVGEIGGRLSESIELVLFRVLQEGLTNVHRHAGATRAEAILSQSGNKVVLRVKDNGSGVQTDLLESLRVDGIGSGVGLAGMKERVRESGGELEIFSAVGGTEIVARVPIRYREQKQTALAVEGVRR